jgi:hypothetical protein
MDVHAHSRKICIARQASEDFCLQTAEGPFSSSEDAATRCAV